MAYFDHQISEQTVIDLDKKVAFCRPLFFDRGLLRSGVLDFFCKWASVGRLDGNHNLC